MVFFFESTSKDKGYEDNPERVSELNREFLTVINNYTDGCARVVENFKDHIIRCFAFRPLSWMLFHTYIGDVAEH